MIDSFHLSFWDDMNSKLWKNNKLTDRVGFSPKVYLNANGYDSTRTSFFIHWDKRHKATQRVSPWSWWLDKNLVPNVHRRHILASWFILASYRHITVCITTCEHWTYEWCSMYKRVIRKSYMFLKEIISRLFQNINILFFINKIKTCSEFKLTIWKIYLILCPGKYWTSSSWMKESLMFTAKKAEINNLEYVLEYPY